MQKATFKDGTTETYTGSRKDIKACVRYNYFNSGVIYVTWSKSKRNAISAARSNIRTWSTGEAQKKSFETIEVVEV